MQTFSQHDWPRSAWMAARSPTAPSGVWTLGGIITGGLEDAKGNPRSDLHILRVHKAMTTAFTGAQKGAMPKGSVSMKLGGDVRKGLS